MYIKQAARGILSRYSKFPRQSIQSRPSFGVLCKSELATRTNEVMIGVVHIEVTRPPYTSSRATRFALYIAKRIGISMFVFLFEVDIANEFHTIQKHNNIICAHLTTNRS